MPHVPFLGRLSFRDYAALIFGFAFLALESFLHIVILLLPKPVINWFYRRSRALFKYFAPLPEYRSEEKKAAERILGARDFGELCSIYGYTHEEHVVLTKDGYLLGLHRLPSRTGEKKAHPGHSTGKPVVYLHHGLLMNSEIWVCLTDAHRSLPFVLVEQGYDVWLGNNRYVHLHELQRLKSLANVFGAEEINIRRSLSTMGQILPSSGTTGEWIHYYCECYNDFSV